jgi:DNA-binding LacI/PurR family transcriptional regulator
MGMLAFDYLLSKITGRKKSVKYLEDVVFKTTLVMRESCTEAAQ